MPRQGQTNHVRKAMQKRKQHQWKSAGGGQARRMRHARVKFGHPWRGGVKRGRLMTDVHPQSPSVRWWGSSLSSKTFVSWVGGQPSPVSQTRFSWHIKAHVSRCNQPVKTDKMTFNLTVCVMRRAACNVRVSVTGWIRRWRTMPSFGRCVCTQHLRARTDPLPVQRGARCVNSVWRRSSTPAASSVALTTLTCAG